MKNNLFDRITDNKTINDFNITNHVDQLNKSYQNTCQFLDNHFAQQIKENLSKFHQRWFEMNLIEKLLAKNINIAQCRAGQPDIQIKLSSGETLWIECTAPTPGQNENILTPPIKSSKNPGTRTEARETPVNYMLPRITSAVQSKIEQHEKCTMTNSFKPSDIHILIINVGLFSTFLHYPFIGVFLGFKDMYFDWHTETTVTPPCVQITKPACDSPIEIGYLNNPSFPFNAVILTSEKLGSICSSPEYYKPLLKPGFIPTQEIMLILGIMCAE